MNQALMVDQNDQLYKAKMAVASKFKKAGAVLSAAGTMFMSELVLALDTTEAVASIDAAEADGITVGQAVIGAVAALVVVSVVISMVRKL